MSYDYGPISAKALSLIAKYGKTVQLELIANGAPLDGARPWRGPSQATTVKQPKAIQTAFDKDEIDGERIRTSDVKLVIAATDAALAGVDVDRVVRATVGGVSYGATNLTTVAPGDAAIVYVMRLRNG